MKCPTCGVENEPNAVFCSSCGASLKPTAPAPARATPPAESTPPSFPPPPPERIGIPLTPCRLVISGKTIQLPVKHEVIIGRAETAGDWKPDVDLTPFGGKSDAGVSRKHAKIVWQNGWMLEDLNSTNGTFLRGQRLQTGQRAPIKNGEVLQIGKLQATFFSE